MRYGTNSSHRYVAIAAVVALLLTFVSMTAAAENDDWAAKWDNGFKVTSADGKYKLKFGGRIQADWSFASADAGIEDAVGMVRDGNEFRRARFFMQGVVYGRIEFKAQYDFVGGDADFKDMYIGFLGTPVGNVRVGHFKEPFSLEELTSSKYISFLERSLNSVFSPSRNTGIMLHDRVGNRMTWAAGIFRESDGFGTTKDGNGKLNVTARVTGLPVYEENGARLLHLGLSVSDKDLGDDSFRWRQRPEAHLSPRFVDTGTFMADGATIYSAEVAGVFDRFWFSAEHIRADQSNAVATAGTNCSGPCQRGDRLGDPSFGGLYLQTGVFLTDDHRRYKTATGTFSRMKPSRNWGAGGLGAWELVLRYSTLDLTDEGIAGGEMENFGIGLNWYVNPVTRVMCNFINSDRTDIPDGGARFLSLRVQVDF